MLYVLLFLSIPVVFFFMMMRLYWISIERPEDSQFRWMTRSLSDSLAERRENHREDHFSQKVTHMRDLPEFKDVVVPDELELHESERAREIAELEELFNREAHS